MDWISISLRWFLALWLMGWLALPLWYRVLGRLPDGGLAAGRILTPTFASLPLFWLASFRILPLKAAPVFVVLPLLFSLATLAKPENRSRFLAWVREHRAGLIWSDAVFTAAFAAFLWLRLRHPELNNLEKPMDSAMLHELLRVDYLPFDSFWFSGTPFTNYYYYGQFICANIARTLGAHPPFVYNLAFPLWAAFFLSALWPLCAVLCSRVEESAAGRTAYARGLMATAIVGLMGNYEPLRQFADTRKWWPLDWWTTTRVIPNTINEYPAFTITVGDLHAHFFALSFNVLVATLCYCLFLTRKPLFSTAVEEAIAVEAPKTGKLSKKQQKAAAAEAEALRLETEARSEAERMAAAEGETNWHTLLVVLGSLIGVMYMTNTWDLPLATLLILSSAALTRLGNGVQTWLWVVMPPVLGYLVSWPYRRLFAMPLSAVRFDILKPPFIEFLLLWGFLLFLAGLGLWEWTRRRREAQTRGEGNFGLLLTLFGLMGVVLPYLMFIQSAVWTGFSLDHLNIVFKIGLQACVLLGIAGASGALAQWAGWPNALSARGLLKWAAPAILIVPMLCGACVFWTWGWRDAPRDENGNNTLSLDGSRFLPETDRAAVAWLFANATPGDAVLEANGQESYNRWGRISCLTGVPTPLGWWMHSRQFGADDLEIQRRYALIQRVYQWDSNQDALDAIQQLKTMGVRWIYVGQVERDTYPYSGLRRLREMMGAVYENGETFIAAVP